MNFLTDFGLLLNIVGTILIAKALDAPTKKNNYTEGGKSMPFINLVHPLWFKIGMWLLFGGFVLQLQLFQSLFA